MLNTQVEHEQELPPNQSIGISPSDLDQTILLEIQLYVWTTRTTHASRSEGRWRPPAPFLSSTTAFDCFQVIVPLVTLL
uniref:Uncharacterized protein n=1 Tax=Mesocestoides corti TaxID=53468 RepID=A0A5K3FEM3_MESCO